MASGLLVCGVGIGTMRQNSALWGTKIKGLKYAFDSGRCDFA